MLAHLQEAFPNRRPASFCEDFSQIFGHNSGVQTQFKNPNLSQKERLL
jgi:hypothetical protein